ncbi:flavin reductase [Lampropedia puyangensis]|uniref:Flavin reductase n=1 Tax=Lampropedia puyangensis TaxID=1330072 RepID=A0A4S8F9E0_9BURK|nr:flavin reductase family protein [Lampropedia puyangensis]THU03641.1 flavin reductase [Lampropedia puyangensis]
MTITTHKDLLKSAMRRMPGPISLITTLDAQTQQPMGMAASAVIPVSMDPPSMLISINNTASACGPIAQAGRFCINLLAVDQSDLVAPFADSARRHERFSTNDWSTQDGMPFLPSACAAIFCTVRQTVPFGSHTLFIGEVEAVVGRDGGAAPLGWLEGQFATLEPIPASH